LVAGGRNRSRSTSQGAARRSRSASPAGDESRSASPAGDRSRSRSAVGARNRSSSPAPARRSRSRSPVQRRSRSPAVRRSRSKSPAAERRGGRSRSPAPARRARSRSRSGSREFGRRRGRKEASRSPMSNRKRHEGNRDNPTPSTCLGVFGLSLYTTDRDLEKEFGRYGNLVKCKVVLDGKSGQSRGFAFLTFESVDDATAARNALTDTVMDGRKIRVDFSITKRAHTPTPGMYMGRDDKRPIHRSPPGRRRGRSPSPYARRRSPSPRYRSRRSPSPRGYRGGGGGRRSPSPRRRSPRRSRSPLYRRRSPSPRRGGDRGDYRR